MFVVVVVVAIVIINYYSIILVRLCEHKLEIVKQVLESNPALCKNSAMVVTFIYCIKFTGWVGL